MCNTKQPMEVRSSRGDIIIKNGSCEPIVHAKDLKEEPQIILPHLNSTGHGLFTMIFMRKNTNRMDNTVHWMLINVLTQSENLTYDKVHRYTLKDYSPPINSTAAYEIIVFKQATLFKDSYLRTDQINHFNPLLWENQFHPHELQLFSNVTFAVLGVNGTDSQSVPYNPHMPQNFVPLQPQVPPNPNTPPHSQPTPRHPHDIPQYPNPPIHYTVPQHPQETLPHNQNQPMRDPNYPPVPQYHPYNPPQPTNPPHNNPQIPIINPSPIHRSQHENHTHHNATHQHYQNGTKAYNTTQKAPHHKSAGINIVPNFTALMLSTFISILCIVPKL